MRVKELIEQLKRCDRDATVVFGINVECVPKRATSVADARHVVACEAGNEVHFVFRDDDINGSFVAII